MILNPDHSFKFHIGILHEIIYFSNKCEMFYVSTPCYIHLHELLSLKSYWSYKTLFLLVNIYILHLGTGVNSDIWNIHQKRISLRHFYKTISVHIHTMTFQTDKCPYIREPNKKNRKHEQRAHDIKWNTHVETDHHLQGWEPYSMVKLKYILKWKI